MDLTAQALPQTRVVMSTSWWSEFPDSYVELFALQN
jgi:hypothetical protein